MDNGGVAAGLPSHVEKESGTDQLLLRAVRTDRVRLLGDALELYLIITKIEDDELNTRSTRTFLVDSRNVKIPGTLPH